MTLNMRIIRAGLLLGIIAGICDAHAIPLNAGTQLPSLTKRDDKVLDTGGTITGTDSDSLMTFGLSTCPGMAAIGVASTTGGVNKVLTHVLCGPDYLQYLTEFTNTMNAAGMGWPVVAVSVVNPNLFSDQGLADAQRDVNRNTLDTAQVQFGIGDTNEWWRVLVHERQSLEGGEDQGFGELAVSQQDLVIWYDRVNAFSPKEPPTLDIHCAWPYTYLRSDASDEDRDAAVTRINAICASGGGCPEGQISLCDVFSRPEGSCYCVEPDKK
ncbi:hypothetical protein V8F20_009843 [Naviculisporaceae sp. PSN 640]